MPLSTKNGHIATNAFDLHLDASSISLTTATCYGRNWSPQQIHVLQNWSRSLRPKLEPASTPHLPVQHLAARRWRMWRFTTPLQFVLRAPLCKGGKMRARTRRMNKMIDDTMPAILWPSHHCITPSPSVIPTSPPLLSFHHSRSLSIPCASLSNLRSCCLCVCVRAWL